MGFGFRLRRAIAAVLVLVAVGVLPALHVHWRLRPTNDLDVLVFDVTVADDRYVEHAVLDRVFTHLRVPFALGRGHVGSAPGGRPYGIWPDLPPDLIVVADGYGVYVDDDGAVGLLAENLVSPLLTGQQAVDLSRWIDEGVPAYAEFAVAEEPTPAQASELMQQAFGFDATGWLGTAVEELGELSPRLKALGPDPWPHRGPGLVLVTTTAGRVAPDRRLVVLTTDELVPTDDGSRPMPTFAGTPPGGRGDRARFPRWIELVEPSEGTVVESWIELPVNDAGAEILADAGLPARWPGLLTTTSTSYLAADGLEDRTGFSFRHFTGGDWLSYHFDDHPNEDFFHQILRPALTRRVEQAVDKDG